MKENNRNLRFPLVTTVFLHSFMALLTACWLVAVSALVGFPLLSAGNIGVALRLLALACLWQLPYAILLPHRPLLRTVYISSLSGWSLLWLAVETVLHRQDLGLWMQSDALRFPLLLPVSGLLFVAVKWASRGLASKPETTRRRVLILGSGARASIAWRELRTRFHHAVQVVGFVDDRAMDEAAPDLGQRLVTTVEGLRAYLLKNVIDEIVLAAPLRSCYDMMQEVVAIADSCGVNITYMRDVLATNASRMDGKFDLFHAMIPPPQTDLWHSLLKRTLDLVCASILLLLFAPVFLAIAVGIKLTSGGPVFFVENRVGHRRREFPMIKFRSMVRNATELMAALEAQNQASGPLFKIEDDPRITFLGRILRRTSLDELPQLINVITGDMSLVGPRPMSLRDVAHITDSPMLRRFSVKPGITGVWQINGRSSTSAHQWVAMDAHYIDRWSVGLDIQLMLQTVPAVLRRSGAL